MNTADVLKYGHLTLLKTLDGLSDEAMNTGGVCGWWSTREIIAHLDSYEQMLVDVLNNLLGHGSGPTLEAYRAGPQFNDEQVEARKGQSAAELLDSLNSTHARVMNLIAQVPEELARQPGTLPWYGAEYSLDDFVVYTFYGHKREHSAQIAVFRDSTGQ